MTVQTSSSLSSSLFQVTAVQVVNEGKAVDVPYIQTGVGFLDHMIDQWNSHAQVGVGIQIGPVKENADMKVNVTTATIQDYDPNRLADYNQVQLCTVVGSALGLELRKVISHATQKSNGSDCSRTKIGSRFCCPLDEALVECVISTPDAVTSNDMKNHYLVKYYLAPYGIYPKGKGRTKIGTLETFAIQSFWKALAEALQLQISLTKLRGNNAHHIVESSFKAFSRALRNYIDTITRPNLWDQSSPNDIASIALQRQGKIERKTKETSISVHLALNGKSNDTLVQTGIPMLDTFYAILAKEAQMTLQVHCQGDLWVDDHHTAEDVSIAIGQCLTQALGTKAGLNRMYVGRSCCSANSVKQEKDTATTDADTEFSSSSSITTVEVTMDLSNRPCFVHNLQNTLGRHEYVDEEASKKDADEQGNSNQKSLLTCEMLEHCLDSLVINGRMTVHVVVEKETSPSISNMNSDNYIPSVSDVVLCTAKAFGRALRVCSMVDTRRAGATASSKGTLAV